MYKVLVVDDEADVAFLIKLLFKQQIKEKKMSFIFAMHGKDALKILESHPDTQIILSDINMPEMDGIELLSIITEKYPKIRTVMVSAYSDMSNIRKVMNLGAFDFIVKPIDYQDLTTTIQRTTTEIDNLKTYYDAHENLSKVQSEQQFNKAVLNSLVVTAFPETTANFPFRMYGKLLPGEHSNGSFYEFFPISATRIGLVVGDAMGEGMPSALFMASTISIISTCATLNISLLETLKLINMFLEKWNNTKNFVTLFYGIYDTSTQLLTYCNAGHDAPYCVKNTGEIVELVESRGISLGYAAHVKFIDANMQLSQGDSLVMYTHNLTEMKNSRGEAYSVDYMKKLLAMYKDSLPEDIVNYLFEDIKQFLGDVPLERSIALFAFQPA